MSKNEKSDPFHQIRETMSGAAPNLPLQIPDVSNSLVLPNGNFRAGSRAISPSDFPEYAAAPHGAEDCMGGTRA